MCKHQKVNCQNRYAASWQLVHNIYFLLPLPFENISWTHGRSAKDYIPQPPLPLYNLGSRFWTMGNEWLWCVPLRLCSPAHCTSFWSKLTERKRSSYLGLRSKNHTLRTADVDHSLTSERLSYYLGHCTLYLFIIHHWVNGHEFEQTPSVVKVGEPGVLQSIRSQRIRYDWLTEQQ